MTLATWNVQGLRTKQTEVFKELEERKIDICILTETKKKGKGNEEIGEYVHMYSGVSKDKRAKRGVSIAIRKNLKNHIKSYTEIDEQIVIMEIKKNGHNILIIGVYAPSEDAEPETKDEFYDKMTEILSKVKENCEIFILGDLNGRVGREENNVVVGKYGEQAINNNGMRLRELCEIMSLKIMNGFFQHRDIHKFTWIQPTRNLRSIIDYVIQRQTSQLKTTDVRVYRGSECGSDHHLVVAKVIISYRKNSTTQVQNIEKRQELTSNKYNIQSLREDSTKFLYKLRLATKLENMELEIISAEECYQQLKKYIHEAASEALGYKEKHKTRNNEWWSENIQTIVNKKKAAYQKWMSTRKEEDHEIYKKLNRDVKRQVVKSKNEMWDRKCAEIDRYMGGTRVGQAWQAIKSLRKEGQESANINLIDLKQWKRHYENLLTEDRYEFQENEREEITEVQIKEITIEEIRDALKRSKNGKAAGPGDIPIELVKYGPNILLEMVTQLFNKCLQGQDIPDDWNVGYISSIYKKGDKRVCSNYRGITVTSSMGRLYGRILKERIELEYEDIEEQNGFRAGRSCTDNIFVLQQIIEKRKARNLSTHLLFVDLEKAYDTVPLKKLFRTLTKVGLSGEYVQAIANVYKNTRSCVKQGNSMSESFPVTKGLKQGCCLSPTLFKIYIQSALEQWRRQVSGMGIDMNNGKCLTTLFFADDQVVVASDEEDMDYMFRKLKFEYEKWGLNMNMSKTEYLKIGNEEEDPELEIRTVKMCKEYKYLGSIISNEGTTRRDIENRTQQGKKAIGMLNSLLWSKDITQKTKMTIYRILIEPIMTYGAEVWQVTKRDRRRIEVVEMDYLRRACGISKSDHIRNEDIRRRTNTVYSTVDRIETRQLVWYGHVKRMRENRWPKIALNYIPQQRRRRGRPSVAWEGNVRHIMRDRAIEEDEWRDRKRWRSKCGKRQRP